MQVPLDYYDIRLAYDEHKQAMEKVFLCQQTVNELEARKADAWVVLSSTPDFKAGRTNLDQEARLRAYEPELMEMADSAANALAAAKLEASKASAQVQYIRAIIDLGYLINGIPGQKV